MKVMLLLSFLFLFVSAAIAQKKDFSVFDSNGKTAKIDDIVNKLKSVDVLFLGEMHDDSVGHRLQCKIFEKAVQEYDNSRSVRLSLEMFERDVQAVMDEYLAGFITEKQFMEAARPWGNYKTDYRPLLEYAKEKRLPVIASNAPRRYVNMVSRLGRDSLHKLPDISKRWLAPLPYGDASEQYVLKFNSLMASMSDNPAPATHNPMIDSQALWDATMAYSISEALWNSEHPLIVHLNGSFHTENRLGTPEHLVRYKKDARFLVVTMKYEKDFKKFNPAEHKDIGDFVILTDDSAPRSKK